MGFYEDYVEPVLFKDIQGPQIWPILILSIIIIVAVAEISSQDCTGGSCDHFRNIVPTPNRNKIVKKIDRLISRVDLNHTTVGWRRAVILSMLLSLIILMMFFPGLPDGFDFFLVTTILFLFIYLGSVWFQWHWWKAHDKKITDSLLRVRHEIQKTI